MLDADYFLNEIDSARVRRAKELSNIKSRFSSAVDDAGDRLFPKAVVVLTYAAWEGFYNDCVRSYIEFLKVCGKKVRDVEWMLLCGVFEPDFVMLRDKNHSPSAKRQFVSRMRNRVDCFFDDFNLVSISARSNLNFDRVSEAYEIMNFDVSDLQPFRNKLDHELVGWRHAVAHGESPDLTALDVAQHVDFVSGLMNRISGHFQAAIVRSAG